MFKFWKSKREDVKPFDDYYEAASKAQKDIEEISKPVLTVMNKYKFHIETLWNHYNVKLPEFCAVPSCYFDPDIIREIPFFTQEEKNKLSLWGEYYTKATEEYYKIFNVEV